jgi:CheY-like chemotaxis protein
MKTLLVEDDQFKSRNIREFLQERKAGVFIDTARSVAEASAMVQTSVYSLMILDMSLPTYSIDQSESGGTPQGFGGLTLLRLVESLGHTIPTIVVTQFEQFGEGGDGMDIAALRRSMEDEFPELFRGIVYYDAASDSWRSELSILISALENDAGQGGSG